MAARCKSPFHKTLSVSLLALAIALEAGDARAEGPVEDEIVVFGRAFELIGSARAGSEGVVGYSDFENRPLSRVGELVEVIPGAVATQHSGSGKANQYFLRGFNLDHGTDFAAFIDGAPINFRTHGHGQGYLDLNFIIPEIIERVDYRKGPYYADVGDFSPAATASFRTYDRLDHSIAQATIGENGYRRGLVAGSFDTGNGDFLIAAETVFADGAYLLDEELEKFNAFAKLTQNAGGGEWRLSLSAYDARWRSTDQVPRRAIEQGLISRLGFIDPDLGGETTRIALNGGFESENLTVSAYALYYDFALFSNFTYFADNDLAGDEFEQRDERFALGGALTKRWDAEFLSRPVEMRIGADARYDDIFGLGLFNTDSRERFNTIRSDEVSEFSLGFFTDAEFAATDRLRASIGLRGDYFRGRVDAQLDANSGRADDFLLTPTAALAWRATDSLEFYANYGQGFHSNDIRGAVTRVDPRTLEPVDAVDILVKAEGAEVGARFEAPRLKASVVGFWLELDGELVFVGDAGTTEPNGATRRFGVEFNGFYRPADWLALDASAALTQARFKTAPSGENRIPQAVENVFSAGMTLEPLRNLTTSLRLRRFGKAPLIEDGTVFSEPTTVINLGTYYQFDHLRLGVDILNLFDSKDADITYFFESRLAGETAPVADIHFHPVEPRQLRVSLTAAF